MTKFVTKCNLCGGAVVPVAVNKGGKAPKVSHMKCMMASVAGAIKSEVGKFHGSLDKAIERWSK